VTGNVLLSTAALVTSESSVAFAAPVMVPVTPRVPARSELPCHARVPERSELPVTVGVHRQSTTPAPPASLRRSTAAVNNATSFSSVSVISCVSTHTVTVLCWRGGVGKVYRFRSCSMFPEDAFVVTS
jgi:hypothetical protein